MKNESLKHGYDLSTIAQPTTPTYWEPRVPRELSRQGWSLADISSRIDLGAWAGFLPTLARDPYVNRRWKRMSWLNVTDQGDVAVMGQCPMAQGGAFNDAESMADKLRYYPDLEEGFMARPDVQAFVRAWAELWGIEPREPILMQITGSRGKGMIDPLQGQGIHADGCKCLSILVINRDNVEGATNHLYADKTGQRPLLAHVTAPGEVLHLHDDRLFHSVDAMTQHDSSRSFERFIIIINSRFVDGFQNRMLRRHFPDAVLNEVF
ncbi:2OG-Fe dioxygenase family protein [Halomonas sp. YLGW01]|uniref:2OG-Fe dioxygenase family protein n=1 Tax=Halomonas sp. YLGW01 TaxID=2773308 RepID=UPI001785C411|nr:2OG-Fe dioxygenase family protein [Halomonas sp. YLGW01]